MRQNEQARKRKAILKKAEGHFRPVLEKSFEEPAFTISQHPFFHQSGSLTAVLYLSRFIEMFGDLVEREDYRIESFLQRNKQGDFGIDESVFEHWKNAGCLWG